MTGFAEPLWPIRFVAIAIVSGVLPLPSCGAPLYDEVVWTKQSWPSYKLSFPLDNLPGKPGSGGPAYNSLIGPFQRDYYKQQIDANRAARARESGALEDSPEIVQLKAQLGCPLCNALFEGAWKAATQWVLLEGDEPSPPRVHRYLRHACATVGQQVMKDLVIYRGQGLHSAAKVSVYHQPGALQSQQDVKTVARVCISLVAGENDYDEENRRMVFKFGEMLEVFNRKVNAAFKSRARPRMPGPKQEEKPDGVTCVDFHPKCKLWADTGECDKNPKYMVGDDGLGKAKGYCRLSCGLCAPKTPAGFMPLAVEQQLKKEADLLLPAVQEAICRRVCKAAVPLGESAPPDMPGIPPPLHKILMGQAMPMFAGRATPSERLRMGDEEGSRRRVPMPTGGGAASAGGPIRRAERLLASRLGDRCVTVNTGWWSYELCFRDSVRQYHQEGAAIVSVNVLGRFNAQETAALRKADFEGLKPDLPLLGPEDVPPHALGEALPYFRQMYTGGDDCDMDGGTRLRARSTELRVACSHDGHVQITVREPRECEYVLVLLHPVVCDIPDFVRSGWSGGDQSSAQDTPEPLALHDEL